MAAKRRIVKPDQEDLAAPIETNGETVTVACKLPHGLVLQLCEMEEASEPIMGGGSRVVQRARRVGPTVTLNGFANPVAGKMRSLTYGGYGMTYGVPKDLFEEWLSQNADNDAVRAGLIFAYEVREDAHEAADERRTLRSGLEAIDPKARHQMGPFTVTEKTDGLT